MGALVIKELLAPGVTYPVVGEEDDQGVFENPFLFESLHDLPDMPVGYPDGVQIGGPVAHQYRVSGVVGRKTDFFMRSGLHSKLVFHAFFQSLIAVFGSSPHLSPVKLDLHEKRLSLLAVGPIMPVVHLDVPIEVVVGLPPFLSGGGHAAVIEIRQTTPDAGVVSRLLKKLGNGLYAIR